MKKTILALAFIVLLCLVGCNSSPEDTLKTEVVSESETVSTSVYSYSPWNSNSTDTSASEKNDDSSSIDTNIEEIHIEIFGSKTQVKISEDVVNSIEESKVVESPKLDDLGVTKLGNFYIKEKGAEEFLFGEIYSDALGKYYLYCLDNPNNAVVELNQGMS